MCVLVPVATSAAELDGRARLSVGAGVDTNARREYNDAAADGMLEAHAGVDGRALFQRAQLLGAWDGGARGFLLLPSESVFVQVANAEGSVAVGRYLGLGVSGRGRDRRGGQRDYTDLAAVAFVDFVPDTQVELRAYGGGHRFIFWPTFRHSFSARELGGSARYRFNRRHSVSVFGELGRRRYNARAMHSPDNPPAFDLGQRRDNAFFVGVGYAFRGPFVFSASGSYFDQSSNSYGESNRRLRLTLDGGFRLPWKLFLLAQVNLQTTDYPDGVFLSPEVILEEDAENHNAISLKLARPITEHLDVEVRVAAYQNRLRQEGKPPGGSTSTAQTDLYYSRQLYQAGVTWRY